MVTGASNAFIGDSRVTVTPLTPFGEAYLQSACPCNQTWAVGVPVELGDTCDIDNCPDSNWLRFPMGTEWWFAVVLSTVADVVM